MRSIKPGRGPSGMGAIGSIFAAIFGVFWTMFALNMGAPPMFAFFGVMFVAMALIQVVYNYKNATSKNRMSILDITDEDEEADPIDEALGYTHKHNKEEYKCENIKFCPYCGAKLEEDYVYCQSCGKKIR